MCAVLEVDGEPAYSSVFMGRKPWHGLLSVNGSRAVCVSKHFKTGPYKRQE